MGKRYLIDSNVIIDFCNGKLSHAARKVLENLEPEISIITQIELFATKNISANEIALLEQFVAITKVHPVSVELVNATITISQEYRLKLPDAIIAATAFVLGFALLSRNKKDFAKIDGLEVIDPYEL